MCVVAISCVALAFTLGDAVASASGLPDGRVYEHVSSPKKSGNEAGINLSEKGPEGTYAAAAADGNRLVYYQVGPSGETSSGTEFYLVAGRDPERGWQAGATLPPTYLDNVDFFGQSPLAFLPSADLSRFLYVATGAYAKENSFTVADENLGLYRTTGNKTEPEWLSKPTLPSFSEAKPVPGRTFGVEGDLYPVGGSPDLSTVYFTYFGTLVPEDSARRPLVEPKAWIATEIYVAREIVEEGGKYYESLKGENEAHVPSTSPEWWARVSQRGWGNAGPWGFYEWHEGALRSAGVLPEVEGQVTEKSTVVTGLSSTANLPVGTGVSGANIKAGTTVVEVPSPTELKLSTAVEGTGSTAKEMLGFVDPYGSVPAATRNATGTNERNPFPRFVDNEVSRDGSNAFFVSPDPRHAGAAHTPTELYVREQTKAGAKTVLVSRDELTGGGPAPGTGFATAVTPVNKFTAFVTGGPLQPYVYGSPDGSRAFFESKDKLAKDASGKEPEGPGPWAYEFNTGTGKVTYLPGVVGPIAASSDNGEKFIFDDTATKKIELWTGAGTEEVASYATPTEPDFEGVATSDGSVFAFNTNAVVQHTPAFNNSAEMVQTYRYDTSTSTHTLACVSCAPGVTPQHPVEAAPTADARMIAEKGKRVFFATAAKLVPGDENGVTDVYEWEAAGTGGCSSPEQEGGCVYLISSGTSPDPSFYLANDESGENVFFSTREGLVNGDTDESYDVYDARVNGGGFREEPPPPECGGTCRPAGTAPTLDSSLTAGLGSSGNLPPGTVVSAPPKESTKTSTSTTPTRAQKLAKALAACRKDKPKKRRTACERQARRRYGSSAAKHSSHRRHR